MQLSLLIRSEVIPEGRKGGARLRSCPGVYFQLGGQLLASTEPGTRSPVDAAVI